MQLSENSSLKMKILTDTTYNIKHISKDTKLIRQYKNNLHTIIVHWCKKKQTAFICWKPTPSV